MPQPQPLNRVSMGLAVDTLEMGALHLRISLVTCQTMDYGDIWRMSAKPRRKNCLEPASRKP